MADLDPDNLHKLRVVDLKEKLSQRGLTTTGLKADLVRRLREAVLKEIAEAGAVSERGFENSEEWAAAGYQNQAQAFEANVGQEREPFEGQVAFDQQQYEEQRLQMEEEEKRRAEEECRRQFEQQRIEDERIRQYEEQQQLEHRRQFEEQQRLEEEERRRQFEEQQRLEEERKRLFEEQQRLEEEKHKRQLEEQRLEEEKCRRQLEEQQRLEEEHRRQFEEDRRRQFEEEQRRAEEHQRLEAERRHFEEQQRLEAERRQLEEQQRLEELRHEEEQKRRYEEEQQRKYEEEQRRKYEEEQQRKYEEEQQKKYEEQQRKYEEEQQRKYEEEQQKKYEEERQRKYEEEQQRKYEEERQRKYEEEQQRKYEEEQQRKYEEEQQRKYEEEQQRKYEEEQQRKFEEERQRRYEKEQQRRYEEEQQRKLEEQQHRMFEQEQHRQYEEEQRALEVLKKREEEERKDEVPPSVGHMLPVPPPGSDGIPMLPPPLPPMSSVNILPPPPTILVSALPPGPPITTLPPPHPSVITSASSLSMLAMTMPSIPGTGLIPQFTQPPPLTSIVPNMPSTLANSMPPPPPSVLQSSNINELSSIPDIDSPDSISANNAENQADSSSSKTEISDSIKLPQAVEKVFALKMERAQQLGVDPNAVVQPIVEKDSSGRSSPVSLVIVDEIEDEEMEEEETGRKAKGSKRRRRKKKKRSKKSTAAQEEKREERSDDADKDSGIDIDVEYVQDVLDPSDPLYSQFVRIFEKFQLNEPEKEKADILADAAKQVIPKPPEKKKPTGDDDDEDEDEEDKDDEKQEDEKPKLSKRKLKKLSRMTVAELKQKVSRPELVEMHDVTAKDPVLLLHLKASRNTVPVPRHWCFKRKYLQGKRGIEKPAFELPDFIKRTGIMEMRQALQEKEDQKTMKAKMRERVRPKLGKIDIDYQKLHDAFFKWQTKPKMTIHGDLYYEGKEFETRLKEKKPGDLSDDLRIALGMPVGPNAQKCPPPWLIAMQRYGPPPSYPNLKIPGLNAPIPEGCTFGYHAGGWGKPPVDEMGRPLYGDVFGTQMAENMPPVPEEEIDNSLWGELESESSEEDEDEDEEDEDEDEQKGEDETGLVTPAEGLITPSGFSSIPAGMETPDMIELRKRKVEAEMEGGETPALYTILPEKKSERVGAAMMGSTHIYDLAGAIPASKVKTPGTASVPPQGIEVALDPSELELDTAAMAARYEQTMREQQSQLEKEDLSDMVAEHAARQKTKRKRQQQDTPGKAPKKYKEFKF